ncbi:MAG TPA: hypothetical protein VFV38_29405 [Ktedonobacteraceae bacterium]|nr:hypothetical protein [Ktedonobacteraceae bacterium]
MDDPIGNNFSPYLLSRPGILPTMLRNHPSLGERIEAFFSGQKPILIIGGEPANGKSLLMGELILRLSELERSHAGSKSRLTLISYDRVHSLFFEYLAKETRKKASPFKCLPGRNRRRDLLPEGETHPDVRRLVTSIMRDLLHFAFSYLPQTTPIIMEAPLIGHRGEAAVDELHTRAFPLQTFIVHSPTMWNWIFEEEERLSDRSAHKLAMQQIRNKLLQRAQDTWLSPEEEAEKIARFWQDWLLDRDGILLSWNPEHDKKGFEVTRDLLKTNRIQPDPLAPPFLLDYAISHIQAVLRAVPDLEAFATAVWDY